MRSCQFLVSCLTLRLTLSLTIVPDLPQVTCSVAGLRAGRGTLGCSGRDGPIVLALGGAPVKRCAGPHQAPPPLWRLSRSHDGNG